MPLTLAELEDIRGSEFAEDVSIDMNLMVTWSESEARDYFASGGVTLPASAHAVDVSEAAAPSSEGPDAALVDLLEEIGLTDLSGPLAGKSMAFLTSVLAIDPITKSTPSDGRANLLAELKASGVTSLAHRQKLATALSKAAKQALEPSAPELASAAAPKPPAATAAKPVAAAMPSSSSALPRPGAAAAARRKKVGPLPPYQRLSAETLKRTAGQNLKGEWYGLELPTGLKQLESEAWGARWLTKAFHATGVLAASDRVERITKFAYLDLQGMDAQGGAGEKAIVSVEYADKSNGMHTDLFVKCPWAYSGDHGERWRTMLSVVFGDGDGLELSTYTLLEGLLPMRIPTLYFADISRASSNYFLITECVPFSPKSGVTDATTRIDWRSYPPKAVLPKTGKYQDDILVDAQLYYRALFRAMGRMAAADKVGVFDAHIDVFANAGAYPRTMPDSQGRRAMLTRRAEGAADQLVDFIKKAPQLFPPTAADPAWLATFKAQFVECAKYATAVQNHLATRTDLFALSHVNLQIDNAFFWREDENSEELECGLLDWYNLSRAPAVSVWSGSLGGCEPEVLMSHGLSIMEAFSSEYKRYGGPDVDAAELLRLYKLAFPASLASSLQSSMADAMVSEGPSKEEWGTITSHWDERIMGAWNVRCRVVALVQSVKYWDVANLHKVMMDWVREQGISETGA